MATTISTKRADELNRRLVDYYRRRAARKIWASQEESGKLKTEPGKPEPLAPPSPRVPTVLRHS